MEQAIALEGGGAKGAYEIGALRALKERKITIIAVAGTSIGAMNGAMIVMDAMEEAEDLWRNIQFEDILSCPQALQEIFWDEKLNMKQAQAAFQTFRQMIHDRGLDSTPLRNLVDRYLDEDRFRKSDIDYGLVTYSVTDRKGVVKFRDEIPVGELGDYILASAAYPLFQMVEIEGKKYIDGGIYDNSPVRMLVERGYKQIICIQIGATRVVHDYPGVNVTHIYPRVPLGHALDVRREKLELYTQQGYFDTIRTLDSLFGNRFYIKDLPSEAKLLELILAFYQDDSEWIQWVMGMKPDSLRAIFEEGLGKAWKRYGLDRHAGYQDLFVMILEEAAVEAGLERFKIYDFWDLVTRIEKAQPKEPVNLGIKSQSRLMSIVHRRLSKWRKV
ncbi:patatin-like phospholipase family protein [Gottschalkiaceae bacterium SANA]|nr:patatin-like phospholipase family protein [Gottschalkiaceae bacterium SANA]